MTKTYHGFEGLNVDQAARTFRKKISLLCKNLPASEKFLLKDQILRSSRSITANIAEDYGRFHFKEFIQFCRQARGSLTETPEHLICAADEGYLSKAQLSEFRNDYSNLLRLINEFINYLQKQLLMQKNNTTITTNTTNSTNQ
ncbi:MAG: four helix bundle protein [Chitinophagaceae bacterium]|nr:MAG: four helix bundle protein [Chitinophagaceae bacterium]